MGYAESLSFPFRKQIRSILPSPTLNLVAKRLCHQIEQEVGTNGTVLVVGCGEKGGEGISGFSSSFIKNNVVGLDVRSTNFAGLVGDIHQLPIKDRGVDAVICQAVLEHIEDIKLTIDELARVLKHSGILYIDVPFIQGYHALPTDYRRFTDTGLKKEITNARRLHTIEFGASKGPTSAIIWIVCEYIAFLLSFGTHTPRKIIGILLRLLLFWTKYFDKLLFKTHQFKPEGMPIPSAVYWYGRKE